MLRAGFAGWDGESAALGSCALGEAGDDCRRNVLLYVTLQEYVHLSQAHILPANCNSAKLGMSTVNIAEQAMSGAGKTAVREQTTKVHKRQQRQVCCLGTTNLTCLCPLRRIPSLEHSLVCAAAFLKGKGLLGKQSISCHI